jgi:hypothetical protein
MLAQKQLDLAKVMDIPQDIDLADKRAGEVVHRLRNLMKKGESELIPLDAGRSEFSSDMNWRRERNWDPTFSR